MSPATVELDTQVLNIDSLRSANDEDGCGSGDLFLAGDTLPNDYQDTELLYGSGDDDAVAIQDWGRTQLLDDLVETAVLQGEDDIAGGAAGRAEFLSDGELPVDESGVKAASQPKDCNLADVSTDEKVDDGNGGPECSRKSFIDIQISAIRSFCLSADQSTPFTSIGNNLKCGSGEENYTKNCQSKAEDSHIAENISSHVELYKTSDHGTRMTKPIVENSYQYNFLYQEEEPNMRSNNTGNKCSSPFPLLCDQSATSLGYILSQEPGIQSQENALCVVDKFLQLNDALLSEDDNNKMVDKVTSPLTTSMKRAQNFARKSDKTSEKNLRVYEWIDSLEHDEGGELFRRNKSCFFGSKGRKQKRRNLFSTVKLGDSEMVTNADNKSIVKGSKSRNDHMSDHLAWSHSQLKGNHERPCHVRELRSKKQLFSEMIVPKITEVERIEKSDAVEVDGGTNDIGPATEMAAEAIHVLCQGSPRLDLPSNNGKQTGTSTELGKSKKTGSKTVTIQKRICRTTDTYSSVTCSKRQSRRYRKSRAKRCNSSRKKSTDLRVERVLEENTEEVTEKLKVTKKSKENCGVILHKNGEFVASVIKETVQKSVPLTSNKKHSATNICNESTHHMFTSPVAFRTRSSKASKCSKINETLCFNPCKDKLQCRMAEKVDGCLNASEASMVNKSSCETGLNRTSNTKNVSSLHTDICYQAEVHIEETAGDASNSHGRCKRRKMEHVDSNNQRCVTNMNVPSNSAVATKEVKTSIQKTKPKIFIRSIAEMLDAVKRKKRLDSLSSRLSSNGLSSDVGKIQKNPGITSNSSVLTTLLKPYLANESHFKPLTYDPASDRTNNICPDNHDSAGLNSRVLAEVVEGDKNIEGSSSVKDQSSLLLAYGIEGKTTLEESPNGKGLKCSPKMTANAPSPVYIPQDTSMITNAISLSISSIASEIIQSETPETSQIFKHKYMLRRKDMSNIKICFSQHLSMDVIKEQQKVLARLGVQVVSSSFEATHFVADKFVRTKNMLEAIAMSKLVVTPMWIERFGEASCYIDEQNYILRDAEKEKEIGFNMLVSLAHARQHPLLQGKRVFVTPRTKPNQGLICYLVKATQGQPLKRIVRSMLKEDKLSDDLLILSCEEDLSVCIPLLEKGGAAFSSELLLNGIVIQKLEYAKHRLFEDYVKST